MSEQLPIIDWEQHAQASNLSEDMSRELLILFIQQLPELKIKLQQAFAHKDAEALHGTLHRLQGACAYCGLPRLRSVIVSINHELKLSGEFTTKQYEILMHEITIVKEELTKHGITAML